MEFSLVLPFIAIATPIILYLLATPRPRPTANLPPGSLGLPVIGQSFGLLRAMRSNAADQWIRDRVNRYGPVSKLSLFGTPTVLLTGPAANKFIFFSDALAMKQPRSVTRILGERSISELSGDDHKRIRGALSEFLRPDMLRRYVGKIDGEVRRHLDESWAGRGAVTVMPLMKRLTFDIISSLLFGLGSGAVRDALVGDFARIAEGMWAVPVNLPFTAFSRSLRSSARARRLLTGITRETKARLERGEASRSSDLIACLLSLADDRGAPLLSEEEIVDNAMVTLVAGNDTSSVLMTFMVRQLANDPETLAAMVQEHEEIAKNKSDCEALSWEDLAKMKFTWRVALETLRMVPPIFGNFRRATQDMEFDGYRIPRGWQVFWVSSVTHMDTAIFHEPDKFDPSRFDYQSSAPAPAPAPPCSFVAFGGGPRVCAGMEFARVETLVTMHYLVRRFTWKLRCEDNTFVRDPLPSPLRGLPIEIAHRPAFKPSP